MWFDEKDRDCMARGLRNGSIRNGDGWPGAAAYRVKV
tara:strand:+ start:125 stop:235 length:111 start_codon:yes stop_codon:yes gene_type:complete